MKNKADDRMEQEAEKLVNTYGDMLYRICTVTLCSATDAEDAVQNTLIKYLHRNRPFRSPEHQKAWLIRAAISSCRDLRREEKNSVPLCIEQDLAPGIPDEQWDILQSVLALPAIYKTVLLLYYLYGYKTGEIATILRIRPATVRKRLQYGRELLKLEYEKEESL